MVKPLTVRLLLAWLLLVFVPLAIGALPAGYKPACAPEYCGAPGTGYGSYGAPGTGSGYGVTGCAGSAYGACAGEHRSPIRRMFEHTRLR